MFFEDDRGSVSYCSTGEDHDKVKLLYIDIIHCRIHTEGNNYKKGLHRLCFSFITTATAVQTLTTIQKLFSTFAVAPREDKETTLCAR